MAELLRAAGEVFAEAGYEAATTNAIAARAGVSPGTLYQFFPNKQAIAEALAEEYATADQLLHENVFDVNIAKVPLRELIDRLVDPFLEFRRNAPGFQALFIGSVVSRELAERSQVLHKQMKERVARIIQARKPHLDAAAIQRAAETSVQIVKGMLPLAVEGSPKQREAGGNELKLVLERYLAPLDEASVQPAHARPGQRRSRRE